MMASSSSTSSPKTIYNPATPQLLPPPQNHYHQVDKDSDSSSCDASSDETSSYTPTTLEAWMHRPPAFVFADTSRTMLVWDTEEGGGIVTKHGIGKLPAKHAESVITMLMKEIESLRSDKKSSRSGKRMRVD